MKKRSLFFIRDKRAALARFIHSRKLRACCSQDSILRNDLLARLLVRLNEREGING